MNRIIDQSNKYIIEGNICKIECYDRKGNITGYGIIDIWNIEKCKQYKWHINKSTGYLYNNEVGLIHNFILEIKWVDHINRNRLDCREENLRLTTNQQNICNQGLHKNNTSGYKGVYWEKKANKWHAQIMYNRKCLYLGLFKDKKEAALAYNKKAVELFGKFACLNEINHEL